jgi:HEAT repeat protein
MRIEDAMHKLLLLSLVLLLAGCGDPQPTDAPSARAAVLIGNLHDKSASIRAGAATALGEMGAPVKVVVPELVKALKDEDETVRKRAGAALKKIDPKAAADAGVQ